MPTLRRLRFGLATLLGVARLGFFIPYRYAATVRPEGYPALEPLFEAARPAFGDVLSAIAGRSADLAAIAAGKGPARFGQDWFPRLDAAAAYAIVRDRAPRRIVEIGSGHSTRFMAQAVADGRLATDIICIDPAPRAAIRALKVRHIPRVLSQEDAGLFAELGPGDVLFIDSSHVAMPGTDVDRLVLDVLPRLRAGVLVHIHDVMLPDPYPPEWEWRGYNEQIVAGALLVGGAFRLVFASHYVATRMAGEVASGPLGQIEFPAGAFETSLWLERR